MVTKQVKLILVFMMIFFMICAAGCSKQPILAEVTVNADYAAFEILSKYDSLNEFIEFEDEGYQKIIISVNAAVKDFRFIEVSYYAIGDESLVEYYESSVLYSLDALFPEKPFVVTWMEWGIVPHRGISFIDENDETKFFYIATNGEDGSLMLVEFRNAKPEY